jgi:hypothetical protein
MGSKTSVLESILLGRSDNSIRFFDLVTLLLSLGFPELNNE